MQGRTISFADLVYVLAFSSDLCFRSDLRASLRSSSPVVLERVLFVSQVACLDHFRMRPPGFDPDLSLVFFLSWCIDVKAASCASCPWKRGSRGAQFTHVFVCVCVCVFWGLCLFLLPVAPVVSDPPRLCLDWIPEWWQSCGRARGEVGCTGCLPMEGCGTSRRGSGKASDRQMQPLAPSPIGPSHPPPHHATLSRPTLRETGTGTKGRREGTSPPPHNPHGDGRPCPGNARTPTCADEGGAHPAASPPPSPGGVAAHCPPKPPPSHVGRKTQGCPSARTQQKGDPNGTQYTMDEEEETDERTRNDETGPPKGKNRGKSETNQPRHRRRTVPWKPRGNTNNNLADAFTGKRFVAPRMQSHECTIRWTYASSATRFKLLFFLPILICEAWIPTLWFVQANARDPRDGRARAPFLMETVAGTDASHLPDGRLA